MADFTKICENLLGWTIVFVDDDRDYVVAWNGSLTLKLIFSGDDIDVRTLSDVPRNFDAAKAAAQDFADLDKQER